MSPVRIDDFAFLSDCHSAAIVDRAGSVDWWCPERFDAPSVFGRLLDADAGHWSLSHAEEYTATRAYVSDTLVLRTAFRDCLGRGGGHRRAGLRARRARSRHRAGSPHVLLRRVEAPRGEVAMEMRLAPRMEYGLTVPLLDEVEGGVDAIGGPVRLELRAGVELVLVGGNVRARFTATMERPVDLRLSAVRAATAGTGAATPTLEDTIAAWRSWAGAHEDYAGRHRDAVRHSALVLRGLTYQPTGAVVAAATTSLPEIMGDDLNFDYRYAWLRDLSMTISALWIAACPDEAHRLLTWIARAAGQLQSGERVQIMYGVESERDLAEYELDHLRGFRDNRPVRVGNGAWDQEQLDVLGEVLDAVTSCANTSASSTWPRKRCSSPWPTVQRRRGERRTRACGRPVTGAAITRPIETRPPRGEVPERLIKAAISSGRNTNGVRTLGTSSRLSALGAGPDTTEPAFLADVVEVARHLGVRVKLAKNLCLAAFGADLCGGAMDRIAISRHLELVFENGQADSKVHQGAPVVVDRRGLEPLVQLT